MKLSTKGRYAVMALVDMATQETGDPLPLGDIALRQGLSLVYLEQLFVKLRNHGLVEATRGAHGGYRLSRPAHQISIRDVIYAVNETIQTVRCQSQETGCVAGGKCQTHDLWEMLGDRISDYLHSVSLQDVCNKKVDGFLPLSSSPEETGTENSDGEPSPPPQRVYLDYNAAAPLRPESLETMVASAQLWGNGSSVHGFGRQVRNEVEKARGILASHLQVGPSQVIFTSGATESNVTALHGLLGLEGAGPLIVSAIEHDSVREVAAGPLPRPSFLLPVEKTGMVNLGALEDLLKQAAGIPLVSVMYANNETGVIQPIREIGQLVHSHGGLLHCDAVQGLGRAPLSLSQLGVDMMSLSSHKIGGPKGVGALVVRENLPLRPLLVGGGQESRRRAGTENSSAIAGFGAALTVALKEDQEPIAQLRTLMESLIQEQAPQVTVFGQSGPRLPNTSCLTMPGIKSETQVMAFDLAGFAVSAGAACSSGKVRSSHVLEAMGVDPAVAETAIRVSLGWKTTREEVLAFVGCWLRIYERHKKGLSLTKTLAA